MKTSSETEILRRLSRLPEESREVAPVKSALAEIQESFSLARGGVTAIRRFPPQEAHWAPLPDFLPSRVKEALRARGIEQLYSHQAEAARWAREGKNLVVVTPTASGKTLCYNLPILSTLAENPETRAIYLFPTKALAQDQLAELGRWNLGEAIRTFTYDGDTPQDARAAIRIRANLVLTNPDMLHAGIMPHHTKWARMFENLRFVVLDELHYYRGVFGSHLANVLRRLKRIAEFYGSRPQFICASATIGNPGELANRILEEEVTLVNESGAPAGEKFFALYNPPVVNPQLGIRRSYLNEARRLARTFLERGLGTVVFANSRLATEVLVTHLKEDLANSPAGPDAVRGYRGGYLPIERREIERHLRDGLLRGVVATNALELGVDIGGLDAAVLAGYPGTIASTWQRAGRSGRREGASAAVLVASSAPVDQFMVQNPDYFFDRSPEQGFVNPDNLHILLNHLKCAAFELPIREEERFGTLDLRCLLEHLAERGFLHKTSEGWHWISESYPADAISLRSVSSDNFVIVDVTREPKVIGEVDFSSALSTVHEKAIYLQDGRQYHVEKLDYTERKAYVRACNSDYFTDAISYTKIKILETFESSPIPCGTLPSVISKSHGEVQVNTQVVGFKKIKFHTFENVGSGELTLPEQEMHTTAFWLTFPQAFFSSLPYTAEERLNGLHGLSNAFQAMATLLLMCDSRDIGATVGENPLFETVPSCPEQTVGSRAQPLLEPNLYLYDKYPGGIGFSEPLFRRCRELVESALRLIGGCGCDSGCPSCVGPVAEVGEKGKQVALEILRRMSG